MAQIYGLGINLFNYLDILTICIFRIKISKRKKKSHFHHRERREYGSRKDANSSQVTLNCTRTRAIPSTATALYRLLGVHPEELKAGIEQTCVHMVTEQHYSQSPKGESNPDIH